MLATACSSSKPVANRPQPGLNDDQPGSIVIPTVTTRHQPNRKVLLPTKLIHRLGFNVEDVGQAANAQSWRDPNFLTALAALHPGVLRFGGTTSMWIDWQTGQFVDSGDLPNNFRRAKAQRKGLTLQDYANVLQATHADAVFDLNMATSSLEHELAMLQKARSIGINVDRIELGNELYDPAFDRYSRLYPSGREYGHAANRWMKTIRASFPDARFGVVMWDDASTLTPILPQRVRHWNADVLSVVRSEQALIFHPYWRIAATNTGPNDLAAELLRAAAYHWERVASTDLTLLPRGVEAWLTEWNVSYTQESAVNATTQTWAQALSTAWFATASATDPRVGLSTIHDVISGGARASLVPAASGNSFLATAQGIAFATVIAVLDGSPDVQRFSTPILTANKDVPAIAGQPVGGSARVIVNPTAQSFFIDSRRGASSCDVNNIHYEVTATPVPINSPVNAAITRSSAQRCANVAIAPYSVTTIR